MIMQESNSASWLNQVKRQVAKLERNPDDENAAKELAAAAQILHDELLHERHEQSRKI